MTSGVYIRKPFTQEHRENLSKSAVGNVNAKGVIRSKEYREKLSKALKGNKNFVSQIGKQRPQTTNEKNGMWKGDKVGYIAIHAWVRLKLGKANKCMNNLEHTSTRFHWANISGEYKRDVADWQQLCPKCNKNDGVKIHPRFKKRRI